MGCSHRTKGEKMIDKFFDNATKKRLFNNLPPVYAYYFDRERVFFSEMLESRMNVADIGTGLGRIAQYVAPLVYPGDVFAIDNNQSVLDMAQQQFMAYKNISVRTCDARVMSHQDISSYPIDAVILGWNILGTVPNKIQQEILSKSKGLLEGKGIMMGTVYSENAAQAQIDLYSKNSSGNLIVSPRFVKNPDVPFISRRFSKDSLRVMLEKTFPKDSEYILSIKEICPIAYGFSIRRKK